MTMASSPTMTLTSWDYDRAAEEYLKSLPLEHFMEATPQATQREITVESFALLKTHRPDVHYFNELLVQYLFQGRLRQVVPDNMAILSDEPRQAWTNYAVELEPVPPFWVLEYVSPSSRRKDYEESFRKYEQELKVPYCLLFDPERQDLRMYRHDGGHYVQLEQDADGRYAVPELDLQVGLLDGWVRLWYRDHLLELPAELQRRLVQQAEQLRTQAKQIDAQAKQIDAQAKQIDAQAEALKVKDQQVQAQAEALKAKDQQLQQQAEHHDQAVARMRRRVEERARQTGRQDILDQLPASTDLDQLAQWFIELT
jgi:Uma2 family endonuclease